jgi:hypothetical protein
MASPEGTRLGPIRDTLCSGDDKPRPGSVGVIEVLVDEGYGMEEIRRKAVDEP